MTRPGKTWVNKLAAEFPDYEFWVYYSHPFHEWVSLAVRGDRAYCFVTGSAFEYNAAVIARVRRALQALHDTDPLVIQTQRQLKTATEELEAYTQIYRGAAKRDKPARHTSTPEGSSSPGQTPR